jgi:hypothetical protein
VEQTTGDAYWKIFVSEAQRDLLIRRLEKAGVRAVVSPWHGENFCYVEVTAPLANDTVRRAVRGCVDGLGSRGA